MTRRRAALWLLLGLASCFSDGPADGVYTCGTPPDECPSGQHCDLSDHRCHREPSMPVTDAGMISTDMSQCMTGALDGDESDIDCGGSCPPCEVGKLCHGDADCATGTCTDGHCDLATSPPFWRPLPSMTDERQKPTIVAADGSIFAIGGASRTGNITNLVESYSIANGAWSPFPKLVLSRSGASGGYLAGKLYAVGGLGQETQLEVYDAPGIKWTVAQADIGFQINEAGFAGLSDTLLVFGGFSAPTVVTGDVHRFKPVPGSWTELGKIVPRKSLAGATGIDGLVYALGGNDGTKALDTVQVYDNGSGLWTSGPPLPQATDGLAAAAGPDGRIYAIGGANGGAPISTVVAYRPGSGRWVPIAPLQNPRRTLGAATGIDGRLYAIGGASAAVGALRDTEAYGPVVQLMPSPVAVGRMVTVSGSNFASNARVAVYAGASAAGTPIATATTDAMGVLSPLKLTIAGPAGTQLFTFVDHRSRYPVMSVLTVTP